MKDTHKTPRLYIDQPLNAGKDVILETPQAHYLKSVLRFEKGTPVRVFNGRDGEWLATISALEKKSAVLTLTNQLARQPVQPQPLHLLFAPIKKHRMDFLIEKAVELGVTDLTPVITAHTQTRKINEERLHAQIIEAAEQCERMSLPTLHKVETLPGALQKWNQQIPVYWAAERLKNTPHIKEIISPEAFLIGPEGGFSEQESDFLQTQEIVRPISLGKNILRAETAALFCLSHANP
ncbi:MAG TPA: 16S rRNA (uracil(1498)-N(3))-methyltransferase [Alphaproteobacteria bacterium]|nr:16S rRNA (uracil(1498)-N(3))-methyltransferase [Alphaproteobacteria bacterium]USO05379.1 MAG: 16S rRNA (uracil(1498)-N(3))-methyltransferase [Rhodospirillales bacterium]HOO81309.1 16S rRNA (uracil(1498)-N(3))-methyltransferase [Alphaproteobacteria bacterium]